MTGIALHIPQLETDRLILRAPEARDFETFAAFYASERSHFVGGPLTRSESWRMLAMEAGHWQLKGFGRWILEPKDGGSTAGIVGLFAPEGWPEPEIGWDLYAGYEGKGYATEAATAARAFAYSKLGWTTAISLIEAQNTASMAVAQRLGARYETDFDHDTHGLLQVWRHPGPQQEPA